jgi:subtilisin family serine protease
MRTLVQLCGGLGLALSVASAALAAAPITDEVRGEADRLGRARVIVRLDAQAALDGDRAAGRSAIRAAGDAALARIGGPAGKERRRYGALPLLALELSPRELAELAEAPEVLAIQLDRTNFPALSSSSPRVGATTTTSSGWDGSGWAVAILDTGVERTHSFFEGRVVAEACFSASNDCPNGQDTQTGTGSAAPCTYGTRCYHGTHVAGIAAGQNATMQGVAPGASIIAIQVGSRLTGSGCGTSGSPCVVVQDSDALAALDYVADTLSSTYLIAAVNMSFGTTTTWSSEATCDNNNPAYATAIDALRAIKIPSIAAAGNDGVATGISSPACISGAVGVGATSKTSDAIATISNTGPPLDLVAPGLGIFSSTVGDTYTNSSGTSMAAPHVTGAFAVLRQADSASDVTTFLTTLTSTGVLTKDPDNQLWFPRIQVDDAVRALAPAACFDGLDNDADGAVDHDGNGGTPDPDCTNGFDTSEDAPPPPGSGCGAGPELVLLLPALALLRRRARR